MEMNMIYMITKIGGCAYEGEEYMCKIVVAFGGF